MAEPKGLNEEQVRAVVQDELRKWGHDAAHGATQAQQAAQQARDKAAGIDAAK
jgi:hypothetical protein